MRFTMPSSRRAFSPSASRRMGFTRVRSSPCRMITMLRLMRNTGFMRMAPRTTYKRSVKAWIGPWGWAGGNVVMGLRRGERGHGVGSVLQ